jgi:uncharacterized membrane protein
MKLSPYVFVTIYIVVDIIYITLAIPSYDRAVKAISGEPIPRERNRKILATLLVYIAMALGWLFLVVPTVTHMIATGYAKWMAGLIAGFVYGLVIYAVFNGSLYAMFRGWDMRIFIQDMLWGISWTTLLTTVYAITR